MLKKAWMKSSSRKILSFEKKIETNNKNEQFDTPRLKTRILKIQKIKIYSIWNKNGFQMKETKFLVNFS